MSIFFKIENYFSSDKKKILFNYVGPFESGEDEVFHGEFELKRYKKGIKDLNEKGSCKIFGKFSSINLSKKSDLIKLIFSKEYNTLIIENLSEKILI